MRSDAVITNSVQRTVEANKRIANIGLMMLDDMEQLIKTFNGKKIYKATGGYTAVFSKAYDELRAKYSEYKGLRIRLNKMSNSFYWELDCWIVFGKVYMATNEVSHDDGAYYKLDSYIASFDTEGKLVYNEDYFIKAKVKFAEVLTIEYDAIVLVQDKIRELLKEADRLNSTIPYYARIQTHWK